MSFETWCSEWRKEHGVYPSAPTAFEAGIAAAIPLMRALMKCGHPKVCWISKPDGTTAREYFCTTCVEIAALKTELNESEMHRHELMERLQDRCDEIAALQSEVAILKESNKGYQRTAQAILEIKMERDALRKALKLARTRIAHKFDCVTINQAAEWLEKGSANFDNCSCEISVIDAALSTPASGEPFNLQLPKCSNCGQWHDTLECPNQDVE